jgi:hypothetical protein
MANNVLVQEAALVDPNRGTDPKEIYKKKIGLEISSQSFDDI